MFSTPVWAKVFNEFDNFFIKLHHKDLAFTLQLFVTSSTAASCKLQTGFLIWLVIGNGLLYKSSFILIKRKANDSMSDSLPLSACTPSPWHDTLMGHRKGAIGDDHYCFEDLEFNTSRMNRQLQSLQGNFPTCLIRSETDLWPYIQPQYIYDHFW